MTAIDLKIERLSDDTYDLVLGDYGDLEGTEGFDTAVLTSILSDARASEVEITQAKNRGGWLGDLVPVIEGYVLGSLLWTYEQKKRLTATLNGAIDAVEKSLLWVTELGYAKALSVTGRLIPEGGEISVEITSFSGEVDIINVPIWKATVNGS